jgi:hypothetical protein
VNLQTLPHMMHGGLVADAVTIISSVDPIMGRSTADARLSPKNETLAREIIGRYPRPARPDPPAAPGPGAGRLGLADEAMEHIAELVGVTPAEVLGTCSFYEMFKREPVGPTL